MVAEIENGCGRLGGVNMVTKAIRQMVVVFKSLKISTVLMDTEIYT